MAVQLTEKGFPMAVKRDYGNFAKASARLLTPLIEPLGYTPWNLMAWVQPVSIQSPCQCEVAL